MTKSRQDLEREYYERATDSSLEAPTTRGPSGGRAAVGPYTTTDSFEVIDDGSNKAQIDAGRASSVAGTVENVGASGHDADVALQGRYNDGSTTGPWVEIERETLISDDEAGLLRDKHAALDDYRLVAASSTSGDSTDVDGYLNARGA